MDKPVKVFIYLASIAWLVYTLSTLDNTIQALTNGIITAIISIINMVVNDLQ
jgi:hypothetical protein